MVKSRVKRKQAGNIYTATENITYYSIVVYRVLETDTFSIHSNQKVIILIVLLISNMQPNVQ